MTCRHTLSLLDDFLDGSLPDSDVIALNRHLDQCESCRQEIHQAKAVKENLEKLPAQEPGEEYFEEASRLILARTGHLNRIENARSFPAYDKSAAYQLSEAKTAFLRSAVSFIIALFVLSSAVYIDTQAPGQLTENQRPQSKLYVSVDLTELQNADNEIIVTVAEQNKIARGMLLMGPPGSLGRGPTLNQILQSLE
ncbi:MAG: anti-sigma factor [bacterium]|nr:anti-sigma factor [bacterium]